MVFVLLPLDESSGLDLLQLEDDLLSAPSAQAKDHPESSSSFLIHCMMQQHQRPYYWYWLPIVVLADLNSKDVVLLTSTWHLGLDRQLTPPKDYERAVHRAHWQACSSGLCAEPGLLARVLAMIADLMLSPSP